MPMMGGLFSVRTETMGQHLIVGPKCGKYLRLTSDLGIVAGDIIGCGVDFGQHRMFYTKNGVFLGT